jgi:hypothetical protein
VGLGAPAPPPLIQPYGTPFLGAQPRMPVPGTEAPPTLPPPPSQSHLPAVLSDPKATAARTAFDLHPSVAFSEQYSDNFRISSTNKIDNFRSTLSPGLLIGINGPRTRGTVSTSLGVTQDSVDKFGDFRFFPILYAGVKHAFDPRLSLSLVDGFARSDEPALANQFGLRQQRRTFTTNTLGLSADWLLDLLATQGYYQLSTFSSTDQTTVSHILGVDVGIPIGPLIAAKAGYEFSHFRTSGTTASVRTSGTTASESTGNMVWASLARRISPFRSVGIATSYSLQSLDNTRIWNVSLFTAYELPGRLSLSGSLGVGLLSSDSGGDRSALTSNTSASYTFAKAVIALAILQDFNQTGLQGQNFGIVLTRSYTGTFSYALTPFIDTSLRASYSENEFTGVGNSQASRNSNTLSAGAYLGWRLRPWLTMGLDYTYTRYSSGTTGGLTAENGAGPASENRATLSLTASF